MRYGAGASTYTDKGVHAGELVRASCTRRTAGEKALAGAERKECLRAPTADRRVKGRRGPSVSPRHNNKTSQLNVRYTHACFPGVIVLQDTTGTKRVLRRLNARFHVCMMCVEGDPPWKICNRVQTETARFASYMRLRLHQ